MMKVIATLLAVAAAHYGPPPCASDEMQGLVAQGQAVCTPKCAGQSCPTDLPKGVTAQPMCALQDQSGNKYCGLICSSDDQCGEGKCTNVGPAGICSYSTSLQSTGKAAMKVGVADDVIFASTAVSMMMRQTEQGIRNGLMLLLGFTGDVKYTPHKQLEADGKDVLLDVDRLVGFWKANDKAQFATAFGKLEAKLGSAKIDLLKKFNEFLRKFSKQYNSIDESCAALKAFIANQAIIKAHQEADKSAKYSHLTPLADMPVEKFNERNSLNTQGMNAIKPAPEATSVELSSLPKSMDWREKGAVNAVKNQAQCGSCWSFCTVGNIEGAVVAQTGGKLLSLSEQELVDCSRNDNGCNGGLPARAYTDLINGNMGLELETEYPYHATVGRCVKDPSKYKVFISDWVAISHDEDKMAAALVKYGPLAVAMNANQMQFYAGGISDPSHSVCNPQALNHGVVAVGFGEEDGVKYWVIRNSWGSDWGEDGYYRITRGKSTCGVNTMVTSAVMASRTTEVIV